MITASNQGILTERDGIVQLTSMFSHLVFKRIKYVYSQTGKLVGIMRSTVLSLIPLLAFPALYELNDAREY
jgi:hypothetical protein